MERNNGQEHKFNPINEENTQALRYNNPFRRLSQDLQEHLFQLADESIIQDQKSEGYHLDGTAD